MNIKIYLDVNRKSKLGKKILTALEEPKTLFTTVGNLQIYQDPMGAYIQRYGPTFEPPAGIAPLKISRVQIIEEDIAQRPDEGVYNAKEAHGIVDSYFRDGRRRVRVQVFGDSLHSAWNLFAEIRSCKLEPEVEWPTHPDAYVTESSLDENNSLDDWDDDWGMGH